MVQRRSRRSTEEEGSRGRSCIAGLQPYEVCNPFDQSLSSGLAVSIPLPDVHYLMVQNSSNLPIYVAVVNLNVGGIHVDFVIYRIRWHTAFIPSAIVSTNMLTLCTLFLSTSLVCQKVCQMNSKEDFSLSLLYSTPIWVSNQVPPVVPESVVKGLIFYGSIQSLQG
uniref:Uncharacterized protein n=1 Tax=Nelumbo nucifera TaxID=4432 RepID=A0A822YCK8_NELNU|nr:TPA_asm: hypothetical protein HUJ06_030487 [Nelumbo nucifera]